MKPAGWRIALYFAVVFLAGIGVGMLTQRYVVSPATQGHNHPPRDSERFRKEMVDELTRRLRLDTAQVSQLQGVLDQSRQAFQDFRESHKGELKAIYDRQHEQISAILRPDQRVAYEKLRAEREAEMKKRDHGK